ncbi:MAG: phosphatase PAP2-related protein [Saprospiraceae bacterium]
MKDEWKVLLKNRSYLVIWGLLMVLALFVLKMMKSFLLYNEMRKGALLNDWVLNFFVPVDLSEVICLLTWGSLLLFFPVTVRSPKRSIFVFIAIIFLSIFRMATMYIVPLEPPSGIIPLRDHILECSVYTNNILLKDLFFSGHTSNLFLLMIFMDIKWIKYLLMIITFTVGFLLLKQHVHYTIDVVAAPFFAYLAYFLANKVGAIILKRVGRGTQAIA